MALVAGKYEMAVSYDILLEYEEIIAKKYGSRTAASFLELLQILPNVHFIRSYFNWRLITADGDDDKYVDIAITSGSDALVSEDRHFDVLDQIPFPKLTILRIDEFLSLLIAL